MSNRHTPIRLSHLVLQAAPGEIIRGADDYLMVLMDTRYWMDDQCKPKGEKLDRTCAVQHQIAGGRDLHLPPVAQLDHKERPDPEGNVLPAVYFPQWTRCPSCGSAYRNPWYRQKSDQPQCVNPKCHSKRQLVQLPWVLVHKRGYLDDVPWHWLCHLKAEKDAQKRCEDRDHLNIKQNAGVVTVRCDACKCSRQFSENAITSSSFFENHKRMFQQPWIRETVFEGTFDDTPAIAMRIGDARIYSSINRKSLVLPPESRMTGSSCISQLIKHKKFKELQRAQGGSNLRYKGLRNGIARDLDCRPEEVEHALGKHDNHNCDASEYGALTDSQLLELEYDALTNEIPDLSEEEDFVPRHKTREWRQIAENGGYSGKTLELIHLIDHVVKVDRLRMIQVFQGFTRGIQGDEVSEEEINFPDLVGEQAWYPAIELFGEGIFIRMEESMVQQWEQHPGVLKRFEVIKKRWEHSEKNRYQIQLTPRFLLLHTLAHMMIRQLESDAGYPAASLGERIYAQQPHESSDDIKSMSGILIYVAVADKAGSLGGLGDLAEPEKLLTLLDAVFTKADWCSLDPVCSEHQGQGPDLLNLAACHGCALIPDTACDYGNVLLDRLLIIGGNDFPAILKNSNNDSASRIVEWINQDVVNVFQVVDLLDTAANLSDILHDQNKEEQLKRIYELLIRLSVSELLVLEKTIAPQTEEVTKPEFRKEENM